MCRMKKHDEKKNDNRTRTDPCRVIGRERDSGDAQIQEETGVQPNKPIKDKVPIDRIRAVTFREALKLYETLPENTLLEVMPDDG